MHPPIHPSVCLIHSLTNPCIHPSTYAFTTCVNHYKTFHQPIIQSVLPFPPANECVHPSILQTINKSIHQSIWTTCPRIYPSNHLPLPLFICIKFTELHQDIFYSLGRSLFQNVCGLWLSTMRPFGRKTSLLITIVKHGGGSILWSVMRGLLGASLTTMQRLTFLLNLFWSTIRCAYRNLIYSSCVSIFIVPITKNYRAWYLARNPLRFPSS